VNESPQQKVHALWLFDVDDFDRSREYFKYAIEEMPAHGGRPIAMGRFRASERGDIVPRQFYVLAEWASEAAFKTFASNPAAGDAHSRRENATSSTIRHLFDGVDLTDPAFQFDELLPLLKPRADSAAGAARQSPQLGKFGVLPSDQPSTAPRSTGP
jgi:uncharacterized protein (DUF1330 family)